MLLILWNIVYLLYLVVYMYLSFIWTVTVAFFRVNFGI